MDLLAVQGTLQESSLTRQLKSINSSVLNFLYSPTSFIAQLSYPYMTPRKTIALTAAAAAKSLQSCPTLCNPIDSNSPGTPSLGFSRQEHSSGLPFPSPIHESEKGKGSRSVMPDSSRPHGLQPTRFLIPWALPGKSTGVECHCLLHLTL